MLLLPLECSSLGSRSFLFSSSFQRTLSLSSNEPRSCLSASLPLGSLALSTKGLYSITSSYLIPWSVLLRHSFPYPLHLPHIHTHSFSSFHNWNTNRVKTVHTSEAHDFKARSKLNARTGTKHVTCGPLFSLFYPSQDKPCCDVCRAASELGRRRLNLLCGCSEQQPSLRAYVGNRTRIQFNSWRF